MQARRHSRGRGTSPAGVDHVVLGFGINLRPAAFPPDVAVRATSIESERGQARIGGWFLRVPRGAGESFRALEDGASEAVITAWRARAAEHLGRSVEWDAGRGRFAAPPMTSACAWCAAGARGTRDYSCDLRRSPLVVMNENPKPQIPNPKSQGETTGARGNITRQLEDYLRRKNEGHLIRIVGPAFEQVCRWSARGFPATGDEWHRSLLRALLAKGPRRRPVRIEFSRG